MISDNPDIYHIFFGYRGGFDPSDTHKLRLNISQTSWDRPPIFEVIQAWVKGTSLSDADSQIVVNWNQTPSLYVGYTSSSSTSLTPIIEASPKQSNALLVLPHGNNAWVNPQFSYKRYLSPSLSYIEFWLTRLDGSPINVSSTVLPDWEFHLIFQMS